MCIYIHLYICIRTHIDGERDTAKSRRRERESERENERERKKRSERETCLHHAKMSQVMIQFCGVFVSVCKLAMSLCVQHLSSQLVCLCVYAVLRLRVWGQYPLEFRLQFECWVLHARPQGRCFQGVSLLGFVGGG